MHIAIVTAQGFNEIDSFVAFNILNRVQRAGRRVCICGWEATLVSMNGLVVQSQCRLAEVSAADVVLIGSGRNTREIVRDPAFMGELALDPGRQLIGAQCSGTLVLARLGLLEGVPACTDSTTKPWVREAGVEVLDQPFFARGNVATAGGCLSAQYLAAWVLARTEGETAARSALHYVAPVGEKEAYVEQALRAIRPYLPGPA